LDDRDQEILFFIEKEKVRRLWEDGPTNAGGKGRGEN